MPDLAASSDPLFLGVQPVHPDEAAVRNQQEADEIVLLNSHGGVREVAYQKLLATKAFFKCRLSQFTIASH